MTSRTLLAAALCVAVAGCGRIGCGREAPVDVPDSTATAPDTAVVEEAPDLSDSTWFASLPSAAGDPLIAAIRPRLLPWIARWERVIPGFTPDALRRGPETRLRLVGDRPFEMEYLKQRADLLVTSPNGRRMLDPDKYLQIIEEHGHLDLGSDVDSAPALADLDRDSLYVLDFVGPSGRYEDGFWIDDDRFVLTFHGERTYEPFTGGGSIEVFDLKRMTRRSYYAPGVTESEYDRYEGLAWRDLRRQLLRSKPVS